MKARKSPPETPTRRPPQGAAIYSTSEARANFAEALETAQKESAIIGFDRYGRTVAALVPLEAIYMLAGRDDKIAPLVREKIERGARSLVQDVAQIEVQPQGEKSLRKPSPRGGGKSRLKTATKRKRLSDS